MNLEDKQLLIKLYKERAVLKEKISSYHSQLTYIDKEIIKILRKLNNKKDYKKL